MLPAAHAARQGARSPAARRKDRPLMSRFSRRAAVASLSGALLTGVLATVPAGASTSARPGRDVPPTTTAPLSQGLRPAGARHSGRPKVLPRAAAQGRAAASQDGVCDVGDLCLFFLPANK